MVELLRRVLAILCPRKLASSAMLLAKCRFIPHLPAKMASRLLHGDRVPRSPGLHRLGGDSCSSTPWTHVHRPSGCSHHTCSGQQHRGGVFVLLGALSRRPRTETYHDDNHNHYNDVHYNTDFTPCSLQQITFSSGACTQISPRGMRADSNIAISGNAHCSQWYVHGDLSWPLCRPHEACQ